MTQPPSTLRSLDELAERAAAGDSQAFGAALEKIELPLMLFLRRHAGYVQRSDFDEEDLFQSVVIVAWNKIAGFAQQDAKAGFGAWIRSIARNGIGDRQRYLQAKGRGFEADGSARRDAAPGSKIQEIVDSVTSIASKAHRREQVARIHHVIEGLADPDRTIVERCLIDGESLAAAGAAVGLSKTRTHEIYARALSAIRARLEAPSTRA